MSYAHVSAVCAISRLFDPSGPLSHVTLFTTPAEVTSSRPGNLTHLTSSLKHCGLIFQAKSDFKNIDGLCIELDIDNAPKSPSARNGLKEGEKRVEKANFGTLRLNATPVGKMIASRCVVCVHLFSKCSCTFFV